MGEDRRALQVRLASASEFRECREAWDGLAAKVAIPSVFTSWEWTHSWWEVFGQHYELFLLFAERDGKLKAILPLALKTVGPRRDGLWGRTLFYCGSEEVHPDHLDLIAAPEDAQESLAAFLEFLRAQRSRWDVISLAGITEGNALSRLSGLDIGWRVATRVLTSAPLISVTTDFDTYFSSFTAKRRYNIKRTLKRLEEQGASCRAWRGDQPEDFLRPFFELHARRSQTKGIESSFQGEDLLRFHLRLFERAAEKGWPWVRTLDKEGAMIAGLYAYLVEGHLAYYQITIDPAWEAASPGTALLYCAIRDAFDAGVREYDFLRGEEDYKLLWARERRTLLEIRVFNTSAGGLVSWLAASALSRLRAARRYFRDRRRKDDSSGRSTQE